MAETLRAPISGIALERWDTHHGSSTLILLPSDLCSRRSNTDKHRGIEMNDRKPNSQFGEADGDSSHVTCPNGVSPSGTLAAMVASGVALEGVSHVKDPPLLLAVCFVKHT